MIFFSNFDSDYIILGFKNMYFYLMSAPQYIQSILNIHVLVHVAGNTHRQILLVYLLLQLCHTDIS